MQTDVLIVGAGPTGLALSIQLQRYGISHVVIDQNEGTTPHSKAIGVQARTLEIYEQIGIADELVKAGLPARQVRLVEGGKQRAKLELGEFGNGLSPYPYILLVEQGIHEKLLYDHIVSNGGGVQWNTTLTNFSQNAEGVRAEIMKADGISTTIDAKFLVGCDGAGSLVRRTLGLSFKGSTMERSFYVADVEINWEYPHDSLAIFLAKNAVTAFFPLKGGSNHFRIVGVFPEGHEKDPQEIIYEEVEKQAIADTETDLDITKVNWFSVYKVHSRAVENFSKGRCFLAGDSAHIHTPVGAQGMNTGIQDGYNLAWKLAMVIGGRSSLAILDSYNAERLENARRLLETTDRAFDLAAGPNAFVAFLRTQVIPYIANFAVNLKSFRKLLFPLVSQIGITYRKSPICVGDAWFAVRAGDRMPFLKIDGTSIYDRLHEPRFHLIVFYDGKDRIPDLADETAEFQEIMDAYSVPLYPEIAETFGTQETFCIVLRPDNYIGLITSDISAGRICEYFRKILS